MTTPNITPHMILDILNAKLRDGTLHVERSEMGDQIAITQGFEAAVAMGEFLVALALAEQIEEIGAHTQNLIFDQAVEACGSQDWDTVQRWMNLCDQRDVPRAMFAGLYRAIEHIQIDNVQNLYQFMMDHGTYKDVAHMFSHVLGPDQSLSHYFQVALFDIAKRTKNEALVVNMIDLLNTDPTYHERFFERIVYSQYLDRNAQARTPSFCDALIARFDRDTIERVRHTFHSNDFWTKYLTNPDSHSSEFWTCIDASWDRQALNDQVAGIPLSSRTPKM